MQQFITLHKEEMFAENIALCRNSIFNLRYTDIKAMTGINQSTMSTYDATPFVSPFLTTAYKIADMYCTNLDRLCSYDINLDIRDYVSMQENFIIRVRRIDVTKYKEQIYSKIDETNYVSEYDVYAMVSRVCNEVIDKMCRERAYYVVYDSPDCSYRFTSNYATLMIETGTTTRKIAKACSLAKGTMTRLKQGFEPSLSTVIKLADFFGVTIRELTMLAPDFDIPEITKRVAEKESISNEMDDIPYNQYMEVKGLRHKYIDREEAKRLAERELGIISM